MMDKLKLKIQELNARLEVANVIAQYKQKYYDCRPECLHLLFYEYSSSYDITTIFERFIENPTEYDISNIQSELRKACFAYFTELQQAAFENSDDPTAY